MTIPAARSWLLMWDLILLGALFVFLIIAPAAHYPLSGDEAWKIGEIVFPVFIGYLATATTFMLGQKPGQSSLASDRNPSDFRLLVMGPPVIFGVALVCGFAIFGYSNGPSAAAGQGMALTTLTKIVSGSLALLTGTTGAIVASIFGMENKA